MKFAVAAAALAAGVSAGSYSAYPGPSNSTAVSYTTTVVTSYEVVCPGATTLTYGTETYEISTPGTITMTGGSYTVSVPVYTTSSVACVSCSSSSAYPTSTAAPTSYPVYPTGSNSTSGYPVPSSSYPVASSSYPASSSSIPPASYPTPVPTAGAARVGAGLAAIAGVVAFAL
ncbi:hypothetical protein GGR57DRAFT_478271 [Xylariaceae sp. FL1272]|nr:hypothetical protein GGR57DRAFT_478271 [Xylariaceae sp. FL1272]